jgi:hypothetical protein
MIEQDDNPENIEYGYRKQLRKSVDSCALVIPFFGLLALKE